MAEATDITFTPLDAIGTYKRALVTATVSTDETITLSDHEHFANTIKAVSSAHVAATGLPLQFSYATNVLTLETATQTDASAVVEILYE